MSITRLAGPRTENDPAALGVPAGSSLTAATLAIALPDAAIIRVVADGVPSEWLARAYDATGQLLVLPTASDWAGRVVRAYPQADWSESLDLDLATGTLFPSGSAILGSAA